MQHRNNPLLEFVIASQSDVGSFADVTLSEAIQLFKPQRLDCFVARAPRNDDFGRPPYAACAAGGSSACTDAASVSFGSVIACNLSSVIPGIISSTTSPAGVTSITARLV